ncbi:MAG TPA: L-fucose/L-arabinose isomerase family protein [Clostridium sp.]|uniref:L-fucose/L-arabinose isomerase family protein n=1 Tax=Clostridium sp. TaxID=1506 RepID=UPI002F9306D0
MDYKIKIGVAPTRRFIFSKEDALKFKRLTLEKLSQLGLEYVDIDDINDEGLLYDEKDVKKVIEKFRKEEIDALFFPHCNFGTEDLVGKVASAFKLPVLLWGPKDEMPLPGGGRLRDTQCGLFATGKVLRRFNTPFTYIPNCRLEEEAFERGLKNFVAASNVVKELKNLKILQIATRPADFWTMMYNEGELLEKFGIQIRPITMTDFTSKILEIEEENGVKLKETIEFIKNNVEVNVPDKDVKRIAALKLAINSFVEKLSCKAVAIQCWSSLQDALKIMPCMANSLLTDEGIPVACETDIHGAITSVIAQAAVMGKTPTFFADWTVAHPENKNGELLQHCGPWPISLMKAGTKAKLGIPFALDNQCSGAVHGEIKGGDISILRFDGDHGEYSMLLGSAKGIKGPFITGTYLWIEVLNLKKLEDKLVTGPYVHHCVGVHADVVPVVYEACKYIPGLKPDLYDDNEEDVKAFLRGE